MPSDTAFWNDVAASLRAVSAGVDPVGFFTRHADDPDPVRVRFPGLGTVTFFGTETAARDILTLSPGTCGAPTPNPIEPIVGSGSLILQSGEPHRRQRALVLPAFHGERVRRYTEVVAAVAAAEIESLHPGDLLRTHRLSTRIALKSAIRLMTGITDPQRQDRYAAAITVLMGANTAPLMLVPWLRRTMGGRGPWARLLRLRESLDRLLCEDIGPAEAATLDQLRTLLAAGHETSAAALTWALYRIHRDDGVRRRVLGELETDQTPAELTALPYLNAVAKETLRMHPPVPVVVRRLTTGARIGGVSIDPGQVVGIALYALHFNTSQWSEPHRFRPDRFLGTRVSPFRYAPFGGGHRRCIGAGFAAAELCVAIGTVMQTVELRTTAGAGRIPRSVARGIAVAPAREITLEVVARRR